MDKPVRTREDILREKLKKVKRIPLESEVREKEEREKEKKRRYTTISISREANEIIEELVPEIFKSKREAIHKVVKSWKKMFRQKYPDFFEMWSKIREEFYGDIE